jgi:beta-phosphoglucomutase-like phosphatase (HAD superfamily)
MQINIDNLTDFTVALVARSWKPLSISFYINSQNISLNKLTKNLLNLNFYIKHMKLDRWFTEENTVYDDGTYPGKPAPDIYLMAAKKLGLDPADCLVFEDIVPGVLSAKRAGMTVGGMLDPHQHQDEAELRAAADFCITEFPRVP